MKQKWSKLGAVLMAFVLVLSMSGTVFAATVTGSSGTDNTYGTKDDTGVITVSGITDTSSQITVTAYPIILAYYNSSGNFSDYVSLYPSYISFSNATDTNGQIVGFSVEEEDLDSIRNDLYNSTANSYTNLLTFGKDASGNKTWTESGGQVDIVGDSVQSSYALTYNATTDSYSANVAVGSYLIIVTGAEAVDYNEAVVSAYYLDNGSVNDGSVDMSKTIADGNTWLKAAQPTVSKYIVETSTGSDGKTTTTTTNHSTANIGETIDYRIVISPIPNYGGTNPVFNIVDTLSAGLTIDKSTLNVYIMDSSGNKTALAAGDDASTRSYRYTIETDGDSTSATYGETELFVTFVLSNQAALSAHPGGYTLNAYEGWSVYIEYSAELNDDANLNDTANENEVILTYSTDSRVSGSVGTASAATYTYTFDIDGTSSGTATTTIITKYGEDTDSLGNKLPLEGAVFTLYTDSACTTVYTNNVFHGTVTSDKDGQITIIGLAAGDYWLKETKAPNGYTLNSTVYQIQIRPTFLTDGIMNGWVVIVTTVADPDGSTSSFSATSSTGNTINETGIANTKTTGLPSTGGYGTLLFTLIGCTVMIISAWFYLRCREKKVR